MRLVPSPNIAAITSGTISGITSYSATVISTITTGQANLGVNGMTATPGAASDGVYIAGKDQITYNGAYNLSNPGHIIGRMGYAIVNASGQTIDLAFGIEGKALISAGNVTNFASCQGGLEDIVAGATVTTWVGHNANITEQHGTLSNAIGHDFSITAATVAVGNCFAFRAQDVAVAKATNYAGFYGLVTAATGHFNIYCSGNANNYLEGELSIGTATQNGTNLLTVDGGIAGNIGGSTSFGNVPVMGDVNTTSVGNVGAGEDDLIVGASVPANALSAAKKGVEIVAIFTTANNVNAKTAKVYFGTLAIFSAALPVSVAGVVKVTCEVYSTGVDAQKYNAMGITATAAAAVVGGFFSGTATQDDGAAIAIKTTGTATSDNDIVCQSLTWRMIN